MGSRDVKHGLFRASFPRTLLNANISVHALFRIEPQYTHFTMSTKTTVVRNGPPGGKGGGAPNQT